MVPKVRAALGALGWDGAEAIIADSSAPNALDARPRRPDVRDPHHRGPGGRRRAPRDRADRHGNGRRPPARTSSASASGRSASSSLPRPIGSQRELVDALTEQGFAVTQATVSRDITELGLIKAPRADGHVYVAPEDVGAGNGGTPPAPTTGSTGSSPTSRSRSAGAA